MGVTHEPHGLESVRHDGANPLAPTIQVGNAPTRPVDAARERSPASSATSLQRDSGGSNLGF